MHAQRHFFQSLSTSPFLQKYIFFCFFDKKLFDEQMVTKISDKEDASRSEIQIGVTE